MELQNNKVVIDKEEYFVNNLALGLAIQILALKSPFDAEHWAAYLTCEAEKQLQEIKLNHPEQIDQAIEAYVSASTA
jgi:hypothetical protein